MELRDPPTTPVYQPIAAQAARMHDRGDTVAAIARHFGVDDHTAVKAVRGSGSGEEFPASAGLFVNY